MDIVRFLTQHVTRKGICATSSAYIFEDPGHQLFHKLYRKNRYRRISSHEKHFKSNNEPRPIQGYGIDIPDFKMTCGNKSVIKRTVLFFKYSLKNTATGKYKDFTYVKLEGYGMKKMKDIIGHSIQYLKTRFRSSKNVSKRVETTKLLNNRVYKRPNAARKVCKMIPECKNWKQLQYTRYFRRGYEIYIPKYEYAKALGLN